ncbi:MAG TPA: formimidoylglutamate deiminase, partial [Xanthomonadaceae bacterium]|nr:formimidoylglutamate deiminase [Xanthomonadaceae bacterium]
LMRGVAGSAAASSGAAIGAIEAGRRADWIVLDDQAPELAARREADIVDSWIFSGNRNLVREVAVAGRSLVREGRHIDEERIAERYRACVKRLAEAM